MTARPIDIMRKAAELGLQCPHTETELSVGCIIADDAGNIIATGYSREDGNQKSHAEKIALDKLPAGADAGALTLYSTVEPCGTRLSSGTPCAHLIIARHFRHVCYAMHEPPHFVNQNGLAQMHAHGIKTTHVCDDAIFEMVARANPHIRWTP